MKLHQRQIGRYVIERGLNRRVCTYIFWRAIDNIGWQPNAFVEFESMTP